MSEPNKSFMPIVEMSPDQKLETTWGVIQNYQMKIKELSDALNKLRIDHQSLLMYCAEKFGMFHDSQSGSVADKSSKEN